MGYSAAIFGPTGLIGNQLLLELLENTDFENVIAFTRKPLPYKNTKLEQVIITDFSKLETLAQNLIFENVFCCLGTTIKNAGSPEAFREIDLFMPVKIAALAERKGTKNLVIISSIGANSQSENLYLQTKGEMEQKVRDIFSGNLKILRPSLLLGDRKEFRLGEKTWQYVALILGIFLVGPLRKYRAIHSSIVAKAMINSITLPNNCVILESDKISDMHKPATRTSPYVIKIN